VERRFSAKPEVVLDCRNQLGESIVWDDREGVLHWANIHDREIWTWNPFSSDDPRVMTLPERVGAIGLRDGGGLVVALEKGFALVNGDTLDPVTRIEEHLATTRLNDGRVDPFGRFVCGGMDEASPQQAIAAVYGLQADGSVSTILSGVHCTNSLCWSSDGRTLYFTDMPTRQIDVFDYDLEKGIASSRRCFASLATEPGLADGSIIDAEDCLWNAQWRGSKLVRYRPDGSVEREVPLPVSNPTCMAFGGPDLDILFVTSAWFTLTDEERHNEPFAGSLFAFRPGVKGRKEHRYAG
jgi:L-arabinonolactonase